MKRNSCLKTVLILFITLFLYKTSFSQVKSPEEYIGFPVGADYKLADWKQIKGYFNHLGAESDRIVIKNIGKTVHNNQMFAAFISSSGNLKRLDRLKKLQKEIATGHKENPGAVKKMITDGVSVVFINCAIHSTEIGSSQMSMELAYELCIKNSRDIEEILNNTLLILIPSANPDGINIVSDWYKKSLKTKWEGSSPPELYHHYAGHDNNRDWFMLMLPETRNLTKLLYQEWFPQIVYDIHQMGNRGPRFFTPPFYYISNPNLDPLILRSIMLIGGHMTTSLAAAGFTGIATEYGFDTWWHGGFRTAPYFHNMIGILSEAASVKIASPITQKIEDLRGSRRGLPSVQTGSTNFPEPWKGGKWSLRDIIDLEKNASYTILRLAARYKDMWIKNMYQMGRKNIKKGKHEPPFAYLFPPGQRDKDNLYSLMEILDFQGADISRAEKSFTADGRKYPPGTFIVYLSQPFRTNVKTLLEKQVFKGKRLSPGGPMESPYDATGWTLPYLMDLVSFKVDSPFIAETRLIKDFTPENKNIKFSGNFIIIPAGQNRLYQTVNRLLPDKNEIRMFHKPYKDYKPGTVYFKNSKNAQNHIKELLKKHHLEFFTGEIPISRAGKRINLPRLAIYQSYAANMDEGWTRRILDEYEFKYTVIHDGDIRKGGLSKDFDAIILPSQSPQRIIKGRSSKTYPDEYSGGIGKVGVSCLKEFVEAGGTLITFNYSCDLPVKEFYLPAENILKGLPSKEFFGPGSIVMGISDPDHPVTFGLNREIPLFFSHGRAYSLSGGTSIIKYPAGDPLLSGYIHKPEKLSGKTALAECSIGKGKCILFGFRPQNRAQTWGTFLLIFNSIYYSSM